MLCPVSSIITDRHQATLYLLNPIPKQKLLRIAPTPRDHPHHHLQDPCLTSRATKPSQRFGRQEELMFLRRREWRQAPPLARRSSFEDVNEQLDTELEGFRLSATCKSPWIFENPSLLCALLDAADYEHLLLIRDLSIRFTLSPF
jgi:hypothetical protein